jgi:hypothetical protein
MSDKKGTEMGVLSAIEEIQRELMRNSVGNGFEGGFRDGDETEMA